MSLPDYLEGCALLAVTLGAVVMAARRIVATRLEGLRGAEWLLAWSLIAAIGVIGVHLLPALAGLLSRGTVIVAALAALVLAYRLPRGGPGRTAKPPFEGPRSRFSIAVGGMALLALGAYVTTLAIGLGGRPTLNLDTATFHLPEVARWIDSGSICQIDQFLPDQAQGYYPANGNVVQLAAVLPSTATASASVDHLGATEILRWPYPPAFLPGSRPRASSPTPPASPFTA